MAKFDNDHEPVTPGMRETKADREFASQNGQALSKAEARSARRSQARKKEPVVEPSSVAETTKIEPVVEETHVSAANRDKVDMVKLNQWLDQDSTDTEVQINRRQQVLRNMGVDTNETRPPKLKSMIISRLRNLTPDQIASKYELNIPGVTPEIIQTQSAAQPEIVPAVAEAGATESWARPELDRVEKALVEEMKKLVSYSKQTVESTAAPAAVKSPGRIEWKVEEFNEQMDEAEARDVVYGFVGYDKHDRPQPIAALKRQLGIADKKIDDQQVISMAVDGLKYGYLSRDFFPVRPAEEVRDERQPETASPKLQQRKLNDNHSLPHLHNLVQNHGDPETRLAAYRELADKHYRDNPGKLEKYANLVRDLTQVTLARLPKYNKEHPLDAPTAAEGEEKFKKITKEVWDAFAVHGAARFDKVSGRATIKSETDLDGRATLWLFRQAGFNTAKVEYVVAGRPAPGKINIDTSDKEGVITEADGTTLHIDHHGPDSGSNNSATKEAYENVLTKLDLLPARPELRQLVDFVTAHDNMSFPADEYGLKSARTLLGLRMEIGTRYGLSFEQVLKLFSQGKTALTPLTDSELKGMVISPANPQRGRPRITAFEASEDRRKAVLRAEAQLKEMEKQGYIIDSKDYGRVAVDINSQLATGADAAKAAGMGMYVKWVPETNSFFITSLTEKPLKHKFSQGTKVRETMWIKPMTDEAPLQLKLADVLREITNGELEPTGALKDYLEKLDGKIKPVAPVERPEPKVVSPEALKAKLDQWQAFLTTGKKLLTQGKINEYVQLHHQVYSTIFPMPDLSQVSQADAERLQQLSARYLQLKENFDQQVLNSASKSKDKPQPTAEPTPEQAKTPEGKEAELQRMAEEAWDEAMSKELDRLGMTKEERADYVKTQFFMRKRREAVAELINEFKE